MRRDDYYGCSDLDGPETKEKVIERLKASGFQVKQSKQILKLSGKPKEALYAIGLVEAGQRKFGMNGRFISVLDSVLSEPKDERLIHWLKNYHLDQVELEDCVLNFDNVRIRDTLNAALAICRLGGLR